MVYKTRQQLFNVTQWSDYDSSPVVWLDILAQMYQLYIHFGYILAIFIWWSIHCFSVCSDSPCRSICVCTAYEGGWIATQMFGVILNNKNDWILAITMNDLVYCVKLCSIHCSLMHYWKFKITLKKKWRNKILKYP